MKEVAIVSGKGGTGKTSVTAALANLWSNKVLVDCDVDAANLHLVLHPQVLQASDFYSGKKAKIDPEKCMECGRCRDICRSEAIDSSFYINSLACNGCSACTLICPNQAIKLNTNLAGKWFLSETVDGPMVHAVLGIGEDNSGKLVSKIRQVAKEQAEEKKLSGILIDGPPGIGCPVISAVTGVDMVVIVTEPSLSGLHDFKRIASLTQGFQIKTLVCINKWNLNWEMSSKIEDYCLEHGYPIVGKIPFHQGVVEGMLKSATSKAPFFECLPNEVKENMNQLFLHIQSNL